MIRAHLRRYGALDRTLNVQRVRLACGHRAPPRSWTLLIALAEFLRRAPSATTSRVTMRRVQDPVNGFRVVGTGSSCEPDEARGSQRCPAYSLYVERRWRPSNEVWRSKLTPYQALRPSRAAPTIWARRALNGDERRIR